MPKKEKQETLHVKVDESVYKKLMEKAKADSRTLHGYVRVLLINASK